jgi:hypothetical protein
MSCETCNTRGTFMEPCPMCLPPPPKLERQLTESKWEDAEVAMRNQPNKKELLVSQMGIHVFKLVRKGDLVIRVYGNEFCLHCAKPDIRYPELENVYSARGFLCGKCATSK